nr:MAG TPA: hypothetical protein [Bacteriophage sp.]
MYLLSINTSNTLFVYRNVEAMYICALLYFKHTILNPFSTCSYI